MPRWDDLEPEDLAEARGEYDDETEDVDDDTRKIDLETDDSDTEKED